MYIASTASTVSHWVYLPIGEHSLDGIDIQLLEINPMADYMNVFVQETFKKDGKEKSNYTKVGVAFPHSKGEGMNLKITPGIAVSGELVLFPPKEDEES